MPGPVFGLTFVHRALENGMKDVVSAAEVLVDNYSVEAEAGLKREVDGLAALLVGHADAEDAALFPAVDGKDKDLAGAFYNDHVQETKRMSDMSRMLSDGVGGDDPAPRRSLADAALVLSDSVNAHMEREETQLFPFVDENFSVEEQGEIMGKIGATFSPEQLQTIIPYIVDKLTGQTRDDYLAMVKRIFPPAVYEKAVGWIKEGVSAPTWDAVSEQL